MKKNNVHWLENNTRIQYSVERMFKRKNVFRETLLDQQGAFVDILRVVSPPMLFHLVKRLSRCFARNSPVSPIRCSTSWVETARSTTRRRSINSKGTSRRSSPPFPRACKGRTRTTTGLSTEYVTVDQRSGRIIGFSPSTMEAMDLTIPFTRVSTTPA